MELLNYVGNAGGRFSDKDNRAQKLIYNWNFLYDKMVRYIEAGNGSTLRARCAYAILLMMETGIRVGNEVSADGYVPVKTEFVYTTYEKKDKKTGKVEKVKGWRPAREYDDEGNYVLIPALEHLERHIRIDGEMIPTKSYTHSAVQTYGLTTLLPQHVKVGKTQLQLVFVGKKQVGQHLCTSDPILLRYASQASQYHGQDTWLGLTYEDIYKFVKASIGNGFKPKDIRTATVNMIFLANVDDNRILQQIHPTKSAINKTIKKLVEDTAAEIGHTPGACKSSYLSKKMLSTVQEVLLQKMLAAKAKSKEKV